MTSILFFASLVQNHSDFQTEGEPGSPSRQFIQYFRPSASQTYGSTEFLPCDWGVSSSQVWSVDWNGNDMRRFWFRVIWLPVFEPPELSFLLLWSITNSQSLLKLMFIELVMPLASQAIKSQLWKPKDHPGKLWRDFFNSKAKKTKDWTKDIIVTKAELPRRVDIQP